MFIRYNPKLVFAKAVTLTTTATIVLSLLSPIQAHILAQTAPQAPLTTTTKGSFSIAQQLPIDPKQTFSNVDGSFVLKVLNDRIAAINKAKADAEAARLAAIQAAQQAAAAQAAADALAAQQAAEAAAQAAARAAARYPNDYVWGNCTWYVANRRNIPDDWGNANNWFYAASVAGYPEGYTPRVGAIAQTAGDSSLGHVAYVEAVYADGTYQISEMNAQGLGVVDYRRVTTHEFNFIY